MALININAKYLTILYIEWDCLSRCRRTNPPGTIRLLFAECLSTFDPDVPVQWKQDSREYGGCLESILRKVWRKGKLSVPTWMRLAGKSW
jgi:hypothetical protein